MKFIMVMEAHLRLERTIFLANPGCYWHVKVCRGPAVLSLEGSLLGH